MSFFKKKTPPQTGEQAQAEAIPPAHNPVCNAETVFGGLHWYRRQYQRSMKLCFGMTLAVCAALAVIAVLVLTRPTPRYFAATPDLRLAPLVPLDKPV
jgi:intracellular multiplication protein IcmL